MKEYVLDKKLIENLLIFLEHFGTVRRLEQLKKPYFSFEKNLFISIEGFLGGCNVEVRYKKEYRDLVADYVHLMLYYERYGDAGTAVLKGIDNAIREMMKVWLGTGEGCGA